MPDSIFIGKCRMRIQLPFTTQRLRLRALGSGDAEDFFELNADPGVMEYFPKPLRREESDALLQKFMVLDGERGYGFWSVELLETGEWLGFTGFHRAEFKSDFTPCMEIGWRFRVSAWGRGFAAEAAAGCLAQVQNDPRFDQVMSFTALLNRRSVRVMEKIGFQFVKEFDHPALPEGHRLRRHVLYGKQGV